MLRALTIEYMLVSLFVLATTQLAAPHLLTPAVGLALGAVFLLLLVRDVATTIHEAAVIAQVERSLDDARDPRWRDKDREEFEDGDEDDE